MRGKSAKGPDSVGSDMRAHGSGLCVCEAYGRPVVEVRGATEGESIVSGPPLIVIVVVKPKVIMWHWLC